MQNADIVQENKINMMWIRSIILGLITGIVLAFLFISNANMAIAFSYLLGACVTIFCIGKVKGYVFVVSILIGSFFTAITMGSNVFTEALWVALEIIVVPMGVYFSYYLVNGAYFFATNEPSVKSFALTIFWAIIFAAIVYLFSPAMVFVLIIPMLLACLIPLWCFDLRFVHAGLLAVVYLVFFWISATYIRPNVYSSEALSFFMHPMTWLTGFLLALVPETISTMHPERRHIPASRPVTSSPLTDWEKFVGMKEVLMLVLGLYSLSMEKYTFLKKWASLGRMLFILAIIIELYPLLGGMQTLPLAYSLVLVLVGTLLELSQENYGVFSICTMLYALTMGIVRIVMVPTSPGTLVLACVLLFLAIVIWYNRPMNHGQNKENWKTQRIDDSRAGKNNSLAKGGDA